MLDFRFEAPSITIPAGTMVRFINNGQMQHSATADDGSFDTGLLSTGGEATITFDTPGTYPYYCLLHGAAGGLGMAGVIIVE
jgi:plastocyanin